MENNSNKEDYDAIKFRYGTDLWREIRTLYESKSKPNYESIKNMLMLEFKLDKFPSKSTVERRAKIEGWKRKLEQSNTATNQYGEDFWACVKAIYESHPKLKHKQLKDLVQNELQIDYFPSSTAITAKAKHGSWLHAEDLIKQGDADLRKLNRRVKKELKNDQSEVFINGEKVYINDMVGEFFRDLDDDYLGEVREVQKAAKSKIESVLMSARGKSQKLAEALTLARRRMKSINEIGDILSDRLMELYILQSSQELRVMLPPEMIETVEREQKGMARILASYNELTYGRRESIKFELSLYGIQIEDMRDNDDKNRMKNLNDNATYEKHREHLKEQSIAIAKRRMYIDSGGLQRDVDSEIQKRMDEMNDDSDEAENFLENEFSEVD